ncbi:MAG: polyisoprenoid-binding protein YceI [Chlamydiales bacterium]|jgi:polyisoprenoid-binding protein YceI
MMTRNATRAALLASTLLGGATLMAMQPTTVAATLEPAPTAAPARSAGPELMAGTYEIDGTHSSVIFSILHNDVSPAYGRFNVISGSFVVGKSLEESSVSVEIATSSVDTNSEDRDKHLRSPDFFNAKQFPKITFVSKSIENREGTAYMVAGNLTCHGVTKPVTIEMQLLGSGDKGRSGHLAGFGGEVTIDRREFGITTYPDALGADVRLLFGIEAVRK